jgi:hypothetical protein
VAADPGVVGFFILGGVFGGYVVVSLEVVLVFLAEEGRGWRWTNLSLPCTEIVVSV